MEEWKVAELQISYKRIDNPRQKITTSSDAFRIFLAMWDTSLLAIQEEFCALFLNRANKVIGFRHISTGTLVATTVDIPLIFSFALLCRASSIILAHNHPSGNLNPSNGDLDLTKKFMKAAKFLDLVILDHLILGPDKEKNEYFSFADESLMVFNESDRIPF